MALRFLSPLLGLGLVGVLLLSASPVWSQGKSSGAGRAEVGAGKADELATDEASPDAEVMEAPPGGDAASAEASSAAAEGAAAGSAPARTAPADAAGAQPSPDGEAGAGVTATTDVTTTTGTASQEPTGEAEGGGPSPYEATYEEDPNEKKAEEYRLGAAGTTGVAVGAGFGNSFGNGLGGELLFYVQLSKRARLVPHGGVGVYLGNGTRFAYAGGLMFVYGEKDRLVIGGTFGLVDHAPKAQPQRNEDDELVPLPDEDIFDFTASVGYERMEHWGGFLRGTVGASIFTQDVAEETPIIPAFTVSAGYKFF